MVFFSLILSLASSLDVDDFFTDSVTVFPHLNSDQLCIDIFV